MKTFLAIIGTLTLFLVAAIAAFIFTGIRKVGPLLEAAHSFADDTITAVGTDWDVDELLSRASPEMRSVATTAQFKEVTDLGKRSVGALVSATPAQCTLTQYTYTTAEGEVGQANCTATATHERGGVSYQLNLIYRDDAWKLLLFVFNAEITEDAPVQVDFTAPALTQPQTISVSFRGQSFGLTQQVDRKAGIGANLTKKIDNLTNK